MDGEALADAPGTTAADPGEDELTTHEFDGLVPRYPLPPGTRVRVAGYGAGSYLAFDVRWDRVAHVIQFDGEGEAARRGRNAISGRRCHFFRQALPPRLYINEDMSAWRAIRPGQGEVTVLHIMAASTHPIAISGQMTVADLKARVHELCNVEPQCQQLSLATGSHQLVHDGPGMLLLAAGVRDGTSMILSIKVPSIGADCLLINSQLRPSASRAFERAPAASGCLSDARQRTWKRVVLAICIGVAGAAASMDIVLAQNGGWNSSGLHGLYVLAGTGMTMTGTASFLLVIDERERILGMLGFKGLLEIHHGMHETDERRKTEGTYSSTSKNSQAKFGLGFLLACALMAAITALERAVEDVLGLARSGTTKVFAGALVAAGARWMMVIQDECKLIHVASTDMKAAIGTDLYMWQTWSKAKSAT